MRKLRYAMKMKIKEIVITEGRPFCVYDLRVFDIGGEKYSMGEGTVRNYISQLKKSGEVQDAFPSNPKFYTIPGHKFNKSMILDRMGVSSIINDSLLRQTPIYKWLKNRPIQNQSLHNIRLTFQAGGIWNAFSSIYSNNIIRNNKDIILPSSVFFDYIDIAVTIHHSDTVSVAISCSFRPIVVDIPDFLQLFEALTRTELQLAEKFGKGISATIIPSYRKWMVKMWHFGVDTIDEYTGKEFEVTFEESMSDLYRIYTKRTVDKKGKAIRVEHQEYPNQEAVDALVKKMFPNGRLINL